MKGHLHLNCVARNRSSLLGSQSFSAPMHLSKPYWDGTCLIVNTVNPTAGFFAGDEVHVSVEVGTGASMVLTSPSAARIYQAREGASAMVLDQHIRVAPGGWLDWCPEMTIPQKGSRYKQTTTITVEEEAELFYTESMAPGRVASGEVFIFDFMEVQTDFYKKNRLLVRERYRLAQGDESLAPLRLLYPQTYYGSGFLFSRKLSENRALHKSIEALSHAGARVGSSEPCPGLIVFKAVSGNSVAFHKVIRSLRECVYGWLGRPMPALRKL